MFNLGFLTFALGPGLRCRKHVGAKCISGAVFTHIGHVRMNEECGFAGDSAPPIVVIRYRGGKKNKKARSALGPGVRSREPGKSRTGRPHSPVGNLHQNRFIDMVPRDLVYFFDGHGAWLDQRYYGVSRCPDDPDLLPPFPLNHRNLRFSRPSWAASWHFPPTPRPFLSIT
jgi:hypothetical protein